MEVINKYYSQEEEAALLGFAGINPGASWPYVPIKFRLHIKDKKKWPVYWLRQPDGIDKAKEEDNLGILAVNSEGKIDGFRSRSGAIRISSLRRLITKVVNHRTLDGNPIPFATEKDEDGRDVVTEAFIRTIDKPLQLELEKAIKSKLELSEEEKQGLEF